jgi:hypothetical protein
MKTKLLISSGILLILAGCSSTRSYRQTPDGVYYSPVPQKSDYVASATPEDRNSYGYNNSYNDLSLNNGFDPNYLSLNYGLGYSPFGLYETPITNQDYLLYGMGSPYMAFSPFNSYSYNNLLLYPGFPFYDPYFYNPFYTPFGLYSSYPYSLYGYTNFLDPFYYSNSKPAVAAGNYIGPRRYNLAAYNPYYAGIIQQPVAPRQINSSPAPIRTVDAATSANSNRRQGSFFRRIFVPSRSNTRTFNNNNYYNNNNNSNFNRFNSNQNYNAPTRTFQPSSQGNFGGGSRSSGDGGGGVAPVRTFRR